MTPLPDSFSAWTAASRKDAAGLARDLLSAIDQLPNPARTAVFSLLVDEAQFATELAESAQKKKNAFAGIPFLLKDLYDYPHLPTTASSLFLAGLRGIPSNESALSKSIRQHGGTLLGKTHLNEFAYGLTGRNAHFGNCPHPARSNCLSGGSSSGSAFAVAKGFVPIATGTDTGGSIRIPAAWCGIYGIRLSPNEWSTEGCFPLSPSFDTAGWFCKTSSDMAYSLKTLLRLKSSRSKSAPKGLSLIDSNQLADSPLKRAYMSTMGKLGAQSDSIAQAAFWKASITAAQHYAVLQSIEAYHNHKSWLDEYRHAYNPVVWNRLDRGRQWSQEEIDDAQKTQSAIQTFFATAFETYDYIVIPATWTPAVPAEQCTLAFRNNLLSLCAPGSLARSPILTIPVFNSKGESGGLQIIYKDNASNIPLRVLSQLEN